MAFGVVQFFFSLNYDSAADGTSNLWVVMRCECLSYLNDGGMTVRTGRVTVAAAANRYI